MAKLQCVPEDRAIPRLRAWRKFDQLTPVPPKGWLLVIDLPDVPHALATGAWICAVRETQRYEAGEERAMRSHMIARDASGTRNLLVHPDLKTFAAEMVEEINGRMTLCNCGGSDCLAGDEAFRALQVRGQRVWKQLAAHERIAAVKECREYNGAHISLAVAFSALDLRVALGNDINTWFLENLTGAI